MHRGTQTSKNTHYELYTGAQNILNNRCVYDDICMYNMRNDKSIVGVKPSPSSFFFAIQSPSIHTLPQFVLRAAKKKQF